jgi:hypothetical protein
LACGADTLDLQEEYLMDLLEALFIPSLLLMES